MIKGLEATLIKLLLTTEFFDEANRKKLGISESACIEAEPNSACLPRAFA